MTSNNDMPDVEFSKDGNLKTAHAYSKYVEARNIERAILAKKALTKKRITLLGSVGLVLGIYMYTITTIKQESFLDDFEEPKRIIKS